MANPFYVQPPNVLQALMSGTQGYKMGQEASRDSAIDDAAAAFKSGDNAGVLDALLRARQIGPAIEFAKLGRQQAAGEQFSRDLSGVFGGGGQQPPSPQQPMLPQRQPVPEARPLPSGGPTSNLTDPSVKITGIDYGPITNTKGDVLAAGAGYVPEPQQPTAPIQPRPVQTESFRPPQAQAQQPIPMSGSLAGTSLDKAVPVLLRAATNPSLGKEQQETARMLLGKAMDQYPQEIRQLEIFKQRPDLLEIAVKLKQSGAMAITNDMRGESAEAAALGKGAGERANETLKAAAAAPRKLQNLGRMEIMLDQVKQGKIEPARMTISAWAKSFGLEDGAAERLGLDPKGVGTAQAIEALSNELTLGHIGPGGLPANNFSNTDRTFITEIVPKLGNDPEANKIKVEAAKRLTQIDIDKAKEWQAFRRNAANKGRGYDDFEIDWADRAAKKNLFGDLMEKAKGVGGQQGMPQGAKQAPDGKFYVPDPNRPGKYLMVQP